MPTKRVWNSDPGAELHDFDSLSPISLPLRGSKTREFTRVQAEDKHEYEGASSHAVANISLATFDLPPDIHRRFASLVETYGIEVEDRATAEIRPVQPCRSKGRGHGDQLKSGRAESRKDKVGGTKDRRELNFGPAEPRWML
jgi:hypothetical protein